MDQPQGLDDYIASCADIALDGITLKIDRKSATSTQGPITDPEGRHAPSTLAPWEGAFDILNDIFRYLRALEAASAHDPPRQLFLSSLHVRDTGHELSVIDSEAAVHLFDIDTIYKPAKRILDNALRLDQRPLLRYIISSTLQSREYNPSDVPDEKAQVVFFPHQRTITVPAHLIGRKRPRPEEADISEPETMDEIQVSSEGPPALHVNRRSSEIKNKSGPGDYYCSLVYCSLVTSTPPSLKPMRLLMVAEAKAPHKLTRELIEGALGNDNSTTMHLRQFIHSREDDPQPSPPGRGSPSASNYTSDEKWMAAVATQLYTTLLQHEARYGYITTGESYILVRIRPGEATRLEYALLPLLTQQPPREEKEDWLKWLATTPLAQLSCLALLSLFGDGQLTESEVAAARAAEPEMIWTTPRHRGEQSDDVGSSFDSTTDRTREPDPVLTPASERRVRKRACSPDEPAMREAKRQRRSPTPLTACESKAAATPPCPYVLRLTLPSEAASELSEAQQCELTQLRLRETQRIEKLKAARTLAKKREAEKRQFEQQQAGWERAHPPEPRAKVPTEDVPYCTSHCIASLKTRCLGTLKTDGNSGDLSCPNWTVHQQHPDSLNVTPVSGKTTAAASARLQALIRHIRFPTYRRDPDDEEPPTLTHDTQHAMFIAYGATSAVLKVRLEGGYVLVAKCTTSPCPFEDAARVKCLRNESRVYAGLRTLQGHGVPVCLASVDQKSDDEVNSLDRGFQGCLLLSWAGESVREWGAAAEDMDTDTDIDKEEARHKKLRANVQDLLGKIHSLGVLQGDAEPRNILVKDDDLNALNIIDFERATTKSTFARRLARDGSTLAAEDIERRFRQACDQEMKYCLRSLDAWAKHRLSRLRSLASKRMADSQLTKSQ
ncbi:hypothetical protein VM1G_10030 [Cytospora mali]|uniref:Protein kinase domain-containing protein n=1 Tax=Cytospora mali TaxID=578113 RepID=A0A194WDJ8_CYTMA|nr:hypothetical protein VM1G_10030 [Valsa mali]